MEVIFGFEYIDTAFRIVITTFPFLDLYVPTCANIHLHDDTIAIEINVSEFVKLSFQHSFLDNFCIKNLQTKIRMKNVYMMSNRISYRKLFCFKVALGG